MKSIILKLALWIWIAGNARSLCAQSATLELYPNYHTIGISLRLSNPVPEAAEGGVFISEQNGGTWNAEKPGFELSRVTGNYYAGCVFHCKPGVNYRVRVWLKTGTNLISELTDSVTTRTEPDFAKNLRTFYVSPGGTGISQNRNQPGVLNQSLLDQLTAGDRVVLLSGTYHTGDLEIKSSGTGTAPVVFEADSEGVVLDGSAANAPAWTRVTQDSAHPDFNMFYTPTPGINSNCVVVDGERLYPYRNTRELSLFSSIRAIDGSGNILGVYPLKLSGFFRDGRSPSQNHWPWVAYQPNTYIKFADGSDTTGKDIHISVKTHAFLLRDKAHVIFRNLSFRYYGAAGQNNFRSAFVLQNSDYIFIDSCTFDFCDHAVSYSGSSDRNTIQNCVILDDFGKLGYFQFKETGLDYQHLNASYPNFFPFQARNVEPGRIYFDHQFTGRGNVVRYNRISGGCDGITCPSTPGDSTTARHFDIYGNEFGPGSDDAFEVDGNASNIRVWGNHMYGSGNGISIASPCFGPVYVFRNVMRDFRTTIYQYVNNVVTLITDTIPGSPVKLNAAYCDIPGEVYFMHNTVYSGNEAYGLVLFQPQLQSSWRSFVAKNNIFYTRSGRYTLWVRATDSIDLDYNIYYGEKGFTARQDRPGTVIFSDFQSAVNSILGNIGDSSSHIEKNGAEMNPFSDWVNPGSGDFRLRSGAAIADMGVIIPGLNEGFLGSGPDPGAFESDGTGAVAGRTGRSGYRVAPNPAANQVWIISPNGTVPAQVLLFDATGRAIPCIYHIDEQILDIQHLLPGVYYLQVTDRRSRTSFKLIKQ